MSLFKRKQSKEKDVGDHGQHHGHANHGHAPAPTQHGTAASPGHSPPVANPPTMSSMNGQPPRGPVGYGGMNGTPPLTNGRRMTSNPMPPGVPVMNGPPPLDPSSPNMNQSAPGPFYSNQQRAAGTLSPVVGGNPNAYPSALVNNTSYPWMVRPLRLFQPQTTPPSAPQSPFPRYGLSVPAFPSHSGHMLLFGGLVHERVRNDLWSTDIRDCTTMPVKTKGDAPVPRVGHAAAIADRIMIVWGGDTKVEVDDPQDEGLYILDLRSQEWTSVPVQRGPVGRYGHAVCLLESRFYVFGGQADGAFMNDLWVYDIKQLSGTTHKWEQINYASPPPPRRTGHIFVAGSNGKLYLFGGTDGNYHYNDTWSFDLATGIWTELSCIGYIPLPREGHAAAMVDDTIYVFGGRDVKGKDLGDLAAFKLSNQRWYMFQNMGPAPSPRSGHAMVAASGKIFIVGGEANQALTDTRDDPSMMHILDTSKIKYPADTAPPKLLKQAQAAPGAEESPQKNGSDPSPAGQRNIQPSGSMDSLARAASPPVDRERERTPPNQPPLGAMLPRSESGDLAVRQAQQGQQALHPAQPPQRPPAANGGPPQRPRREGDEEFKRAMSPTHNGPASPSQPGLGQRVTSPPNGPASPPQNPRTGFNASILGTRSPSPRLRIADNGERAAPPPDAFYYGRSPTTNGFGGRPGSLSGANDLMRELRSKDAEIETGRKREAALKVILSRAVQQGFVAANEEEVDLPNGRSSEGDSEVIHKLTDALVRLKQDKATIQNDLVTQMRLASDRAMEAERLRRGALQEAAFYRAKMATLESNSPLDLARIEKERIIELERQLGILSAEHAVAQKELDNAHDTATQAKSMHIAASEREADTLQRAEEAENHHREAIEQIEELEHKVSTTEQTLREHTERLITLSSTVQQREAERDHLQSQLDDAIAARDENIALIEQAQAAISAAGLRTSEMEASYAKANARVSQLEEELAETKVELEARGRDADLAGERMREVENAYAKSREEADSLRAVTTSRLGELLDSHKELRADESRLTRGHQEQLRALEEEGKSLRKMLIEAGQRVDAAESGVSSHRSKNRELEGKVQALRGELRASKTKLISVQGEVARLKDAQSGRDAEIREREAAVTEVETRCTVLRNLLADHGIAVNDSDLDTADPSSTRELESQLRDRRRAHEASQREMNELRLRCEEAEDRVESLGRLVERIKDARSPTSISMRSPTPTGDSDRRVGELEKRLVDMEKEHKEKVKGIEADYQTAVRYVKGTEKMLKRMKDELNKQKATNASLQAELDNYRGRSSIEPGATSRSRDLSGRSTPSPAETDLQRKLASLSTQHQKLQEEFRVSQDVLQARNREVELLRMRVEESEREVEVLREDLGQAQKRIQTLLEVGGVFSDDEDEGEGEGGSEEASMAFDKFTKELKQWERSRSPNHASHGIDEHDEATDDEHDHENEHGTYGDRSSQAHQSYEGRGQGQGQGQGQDQGHRRHSSEYSGDWVQ